MKIILFRRGKNGQRVRNGVKVLCETERVATSRAAEGVRITTLYGKDGRESFEVFVSRRELERMLAMSEQEVGSTMTERRSTQP